MGCARHMCIIWFHIFLQSYAAIWFRATSSTIHVGCWWIQSAYGLGLCCASSSFTAFSICMMCSDLVPQVLLYMWAVFGYILHQDTVLIDNHRVYSNIHLWHYWCRTTSPTLFVGCCRIRSASGLCVGWLALCFIVFSSWMVCTWCSWITCDPVDETHA